MLILFVLLYVLSVPLVESANKQLYIGGIFPMTGGWAGGKGCRPAVDMALEDINKHPDILQGYTLNMVANDSMVSNQPLLDLPTWYCWIIEIANYITMHVVPKKYVFEIFELWSIRFRIFR